MIVRSDLLRGRGKGGRILNFIFSVQLHFLFSDFRLFIRPCLQANYCPLPTTTYPTPMAPMQYEKHRFENFRCPF